MLARGAWDLRHARNAERVGTQRTPVLYKVRIALAEKKFEYALVEDSPWFTRNAVADLNPLGKIPVLVLDDGTRLFDSRVIVEYLDTVSPVSRLIPEPSRQRIAVVVELAEEQARRAPELCGHRAARRLTVAPARGFPPVGGSHPSCRGFRRFV
jgi:glutathione S-transferase